MVWWRRKEEKESITCEHDWERIGKFFKDERSLYRNECDEVVVYETLICKTCGAHKKHIILTKKFPLYILGRSVEHIEFIQKLERLGYQDEEDYILKR